MMFKHLMALLLPLYLLLPLLLTGLSLGLGLLLLAQLKGYGAPAPFLGLRGLPHPRLLELFNRWLGLLQLLPLLLSLVLLLLRSWGGEWPLGGLSLGATGEAFGPSLTFTELGFFFALMAQLVLVLTDLNFRCSPLEERSREGATGPSGETRRGHRAHRQLVFGLALALLQLLLLLFFYTDNLLVFFTAFEASVLPIFLLMGFFGKRSQKFRAMAYLLFFTLLSALPLLGLLLLLYQRSGTVDYGQLLLLQQRGLLLTPAELPWAFMAFFLPFGVKMAAFPLHGWLPEAHVEASTEGSMLLSGVLLKVGLYGVLRCCLELCAGATLGLAPYLLTLALVGALITSLSAYRQLDLKKIIAYSSVVHMNLSLMGCFCLSSTALSGTLYLNFGHAVVSAGLFAAVGVLQDRTRTRSLLELSGLDRSMPLWSFCLLLLLLANAGMPGTVGFLGEAGMLWGCFQSFGAVGFLALPAVGLMGLRNLLLYAQLCWGVSPAFMNPLLLPHTPAAAAVKPLEASLLLRHWDVAPQGNGLTLLLLTGLSLGLGIWPQPLLQLLEESSLTLSGMPEVFGVLGAEGSPIEALASRENSFGDPSLEGLAIYLYATPEEEEEAREKKLEKFLSELDLTPTQKYGLAGKGGLLRLQQAFNHQWRLRSLARERLRLLEPSYDITTGARSMDHRSPLELQLTKDLEKPLKLGWQELDQQREELSSELQLSLEQQVLLLEELSPYRSPQSLEKDLQNLEECRSLLVQLLGRSREGGSQHTKLNQWLKTVDKELTLLQALLAKKINFL